MNVRGRSWKKTRRKSVENEVKMEHVKRSMEENELNGRDLGRARKNKEEDNLL